MISRIRVLAAASALAVLAVTSSTDATNAQGATAEWTFAPRGIFADERVVQSMHLQMDTDAAAAAGGVSLAYLGNAELFAPTEDALILLMAAGILGHEATQATGLTVSRGCRVWSGGANGAESDALTATGAALAQELSRVWEDLGVSFAPCETTMDPTLADLLVFPAGSPPPEVDFMGFDASSSFLASAPPPPPLPGAAPGGTGGGEGPAPASTGSLGVSEGNPPAVEVTSAILLTALIVVLARTLTRRQTGHR